MRKFLLTIAFALLSGIGVKAQNYVHIVQKDSTTSVNLNEVESLDFITGVWKSIGKALYTDDLVTAFFNAENVTYEVEVEQDMLNPNMIRLVDPYGAAYPHNSPGDYDTKKNYYITFNCEDPEGVYIDGWCEMGMDWGYGMFSMTSYGYYLMAKGYYSFDELKAAGYMGTLDENLCITFPVKGLIIQMADWGMTYANKNGAFKLDLSTTTFAKTKQRGKQAEREEKTKKEGEMTFKVAEDTFIAE